MTKTLPVLSFAKLETGMPMPHLLDIQTRAFQSLLQPDGKNAERSDVGLERVFKDLFPIQDVNGNYSLEFVKYALGEPKYTVEECIERDMTYSVPLKATLQLVVMEEVGETTKTKRPKNIIEKEVYLGELPILTPLGTFVINGAERVIVSQLHRSPGVVFEESIHPNGQRLFSARIIPFRGSWVEFTVDIHDVIYVHIDKKKKFPATALLRAFGYGTNADILKLFYALKEIDITGKLEGRAQKREVLGTLLAADVPDPENKKGEPLARVGDEPTLERFTAFRRAGITAVRVFAGYTSLDLREDAQPTTTQQAPSKYVLAFDVADPDGEVVGEAGRELSDTLRKKLLKAGVTKVDVLLPAGRSESPLIKNTLAKDPTHTEAEALAQIYTLLRPGEAPNIETAREALKRLFFHPKRYDLGRVGRYKINQRLKVNEAKDNTVLTENDFIAIIRYLIELSEGRGYTDDIDHLGNRRVRSVGELIANQFSVGLSRMARLIKERMSINNDPERITLDDLVNARTVSAVIQAFFGSSQLSQFMDQTNPLAELTHKRRLSALGPRGLSRERAGFEVRDVHPTHYGRICPIETPEGPNIGLISSLSTYARTNEFGFIETPYRKVNGGRVTDEIIFLTALEEERFVIAQANAEIDRTGKFVQERVSARKGGEFRMVPPEELHYMDVSPKQLVSVAAALIPFLENDDANRALMGSNMQRQAVPLLQPEAPLVGTGMEHVVARDSGSVVVAKRPGVVEYVSADRVVVRAESRSKKTDPVQDLPLDIYNLTKYRRSNQNTCINQKPIVKKGGRVSAGDVVADGPGTDQGELALGRNVLVAFMPWGGYNFEDAILVSERLVKDDRFTSIHIEEFEIQARDTKLGKEEVTRDIPNVAEEALKDLDESGIVRIGAKVKPGDILVGKITPKGETQLTPEEKLLRAIFGEKAGDVRGTSLTVPPGIEGTVVDVKVFSRRGVDKDERAKSIEEEEVARLEKDYQDEIAMVEMERDQKLKNLLVGKTAFQDMVDPVAKKKLTKKGDRIERVDLDNYSWNELKKIKVKEDEGLANTIKKIEELAEEQISIYDTMLEERIGRLRRGDDLPPGVIKMVKVYVAVKRKLSVGDKMAGRHGNKGVVSKIRPEEDMPYLPDGTSAEIVLNPLGVPSRMNVGQILETHLGWAARALGLWVASPVFDGATEEEIKEHLRQAGLPTSGKTVLYDGRTGKRFHQEVTVGQIYILKLAHLVDDKMHARSIGPYSLVTQQPLGGKAQFGGQRFGEMEVWALEAYGAAHTLQEMLTVKSDDVEGRNRIYEAIVKGENFLEPGTPESFNVLVKELQSLALDVELIMKDGKKAS